MTQTPVSAHPSPQSHAVGIPTIRRAGRAEQPPIYSDELLLTDYVLHWLA
jgi:hypothetical protein